VLLAVLTPAELREFFPAAHLAALRELAPDLRLLDPTGLSAEAFAAELAAADPAILLACWKTPPLPASLPPRLRYVCHVTGSVKKLVTREHLDRGLLVTNWGDSISRTVAEAAELSERPSTVAIRSMVKVSSGLGSGSRRAGGWFDEGAGAASRPQAAQPRAASRSWPASVALMADTASRRAAS
jgi:hypothetical protein